MSQEVKQQHIEQKTGTQVLCNFFRELGVIVEEYGIPDWDEWVIMRFGRPYLKDEVSKSDFGFSHQKAQNTAYWNIKASSHLAEDIYNKTQWKDWNSSKWCWGDPVKWNKYWKEEK